MKTSLLTFLIGWLCLLFSALAVATSYTEQAKLTPSDRATFYNRFGTSVALSGDTALVAASGTKSAYVFVRDGSTWKEQQKLTDTHLSNGWGVALSGDTALVGSSVFVRSGTTWSLQQKLSASGGGVALSGNTALVGAEVFVRSGTTWHLQQKLIEHSGWYETALSGDTALLGHFRDDGKGEESGAAYVFVRSGTTWSLQQKLTASDGDLYDKFGYAVALSGDTALIGAYGKMTAREGHGAAYVFVRDGTTWSQQQKLYPSDGTLENSIPVKSFGIAVALAANTALVGADEDQDKGSFSGAAYVFVRSGTTWSQQQKLTASDGAEDDYFGVSVALSGDTVLVGASQDYDEKGAAYVFVAPATQSVQFLSSSYTVNEDEGSANITVTRTGGSDGAVSVDYAINDITSGTLFWADGDATNKILTIDIIDDTDVESDETLIVQLKNITGGAVIGIQDTTVLTIVDNDADLFITFEELKPVYHVAETLVVDLLTSMTSPSERVDLWVAVQLPDNTLFFLTPDPPFSLDPQPYRQNLEKLQTSYRILETEVPAGIGGGYIFYALYVQAGKNPLTDDASVFKSSLAIATTMLKDHLEFLKSDFNSSVTWEITNLTNNGSPFKVIFESDGSITENTSDGIFSDTDTWEINDQGYLLTIFSFYIPFITTHKPMYKDADGCYITTTQYRMCKK
jgi:hypothetical protein